MDAPEPAAYCVAGRPHTIIVTTAALGALDAAQLDAVIAHEHAHLAGRHPQLLTLIRALATTLPRLALTRTSKPRSPASWKCRPTTPRPRPQPASAAARTHRPRRNQPHRCGRARRRRHRRPGPRRTTRHSTGPSRAVAHAADHGRHAGPHPDRAATHHRDGSQRRRDVQPDVGVSPPGRRDRRTRISFHYP
ncbi:M48 family metalloprotease [Nocardia sp. NPDC051321]|uniref:M48 family metalloprotease n=1 Tax=Nocardia sp. NPDC051321 TaxID=3364323 RepID=UPI0037A806D2